MKKITQSLEYAEDQRYELTNNLSDWHRQHPLADQGVDFDLQYMWAIMEDHDALAFVLKHPQWSHRFTTI